MVATVGLLLVIFGTNRTNAKATPFAVGAYIAAAYFFTSSTSFANPAVTVGRMFSDTFAGIAPERVPAFVVDAARGRRDRARADRRAVPHGRRRRRRRPPPVGVVVTDRPTVLFVCVHNAGRSQMAAALLDRYAAGRIDVRSAGSAPADTLNPAVVEAMAEVGIDLTTERPKLLTDDAVREADVVITMGCGDACPFFPGKQYLDWELDDPAGRGRRRRSARSATRSTAGSAPSPTSCSPSAPPDPRQVAGLGHEAGPGQHAHRALGGDVHHHGVTRLPVRHEGHDAVVAGVGRLHHTLGTVDSHLRHPITRV